MYLFTYADDRIQKNKLLFICGLQVLSLPERRIMERGESYLT